MRLPHARGFGIWLFLVVVGLVFGLAAEVAAQSQAGTGQIVGTVYDSTGALVPKAKVTLYNKETGLTREATASDEGQYRFILLPPGLYTVTFTHTGFKTYKAQLEVTVGAAATVNATLALGEVTQVVEVQATALIETTSPTSDSLINLNSISALPIPGRRFHQFAVLTPTVQIEGQRNQISFAGQRGINGNVTIDGVDYNQPFFGGMRGGERSNDAFSIPQEAISQFQIVPYGYSVEFGRTSGGLMNAVTKSGTNDWHGSAFYQIRHADLARKNALNRKALDSLHQVGASLGGPIRRDKAFGFFAYEQQINNNPRQVIFRRLDMISPTQPNPTTFQLEAFNFFRSIETPFTQTNDAITFLGKWDQQFTPNQRVSVRYHYAKNEALNAVATGNQISPETNRALESNGTEGDRSNNVTGQWTAIFSPRVVLETRGQYSRENRPRVANAKKPGINSAIGDTGTRSFLPTDQFDYRVQVAGNLNWTRGRHNLKFGGEFNHLFADQIFAFNQFGIFGFRTTTVATILNILSVGSGGAGDPANRFDNPLVTYRLNIGNGLLKLSMREMGFFAQDAWRITPRFTLTAGFRWEGYFNPSPDTSNQTLTNSVRNFTFPIGRVDPGFIPDNLKQFMPRVGIAWDPWGDAKTVIRANAGLYYARTPLLLFAAPLNNFRTPPGDLSVELPFQGVPTCNTVYCQMLRIGIDLNASSLGNLPALTQQQLQAIAASLGLPLRVDANPITWANNYEAPRSWQWSVGMQRELSRGWKVGGDFVSINTVHLERNRDYNLPTPVVVPTDLSRRPCFGVRGGSVCSTRARPLSGAGISSMQVRESNGRSLYRAFVLRNEYRRGRYHFQTSYTLSYNNSDDDNERSAGGQDAVNAFDLQAEYGPSRLDTRHQFVFSTVVDLPLDFTVGASARFRSGSPFSPSTAADSNGDGFSNDRAFQAPGVPFGRNSFRDRATRNTDVRVAKHIKLRERMRLELTADFFNLFSFDNVTYGGRNQEFGRGVNPATGAIEPPAPSFQRLRNPASCFPQDPTGNPSCYDTNNNVGAPFTAQFGVRFQF